ncbi:hypothetical protein P691DRAFT_680895 [Macrolepiota fuliginosa MF-IS2]|uniref:DUF7223 domain-containing protein n=1 Tax=Macrolepiota fuliginosa MF-IS2 TaxID=1400762 RepID=A0A9P5X3I1_9AGAR|nr:hypothetical protein P691DRAFT_680895 [Macrolepiota fuliginosa MF-IS2]
MIPFINIKLPSVILAILVSSQQVYALTNDWSKPCFEGVCHYDLPTSANNTGPSGTLKIWGDKSSITDITTAAGWEVLGCDPDAMEQDVRLVCRNGEETVDGWGAVGKIVRLPQECGKNPFGIIAKAWVPSDQSIPQSVRKRLVRRDGEVPVVKAITLMNFALVAANVPGATAQGDLDTSKVPTNSPGHAVHNSTFVSDSLAGFPDLNDFGTSQSLALPPLNIDQSLTLLDAKLTCTQKTGVGNSTVGVDATLKVDVEAKAQAAIVIGVTVSGTFLPPQLTTFGISSSITADFGGTIKVDAGLGGTIDSGKLPIVNVPIGGVLDIEPIISVKPTFQINAQASASLNLDLGLTIGVNYNITDARFVFPTPGSLGGTFTPGDTPLTLSAQPSVKGTGTVVGHITPSLNLDVTSFGQKVGVSLSLDASATLMLTGDGTGAEQNVTVSPREAEAGHADGMIVPRERGIVGEADVGRRSPLAVEDTVTGDGKMSSVATRADAPPPVTFGGCAEIDTALEVDVGANANFFGFFGPMTKIPLFSGKFTLFKVGTFSTA